MKPIANGAGAGVKQSLATAIAMILNAVTVAAVLLRAIIGVTKPCAHFKGQAAEPDAFKLRERLKIQVSIEILAIGKAAQAVVTLTDIAHTDVETADPAGNADTRK